MATPRKNLPDRERLLWLEKLSDSYARPFTLEPTQAASWHSEPDAYMTIKTQDAPMMEFVDVDNAEHLALLLNELPWLLKMARKGLRAG